MMSDPKNIALVSIESVPDGMRPLGLVRGSTARARNIARDISGVEEPRGWRGDVLHKAYGRRSRGSDLPDAGRRGSNGCNDGRGCEICIIDGVTGRIGNGGLGHSCWPNARSIDRQ